MQSPDRFCPIHSFARVIGWPRGRSLSDAASTPYLRGGAVSSRVSASRGSRAPASRWRTDRDPSEFDAFARRA